MEQGSRLPEEQGPVKPSAAENAGGTPTARDEPQRRARRIWPWILGLAALPLLFLCGLVAVYRFVPPLSTLMLDRWASQHRFDREWVPLDRISPWLQAAVIMSEDGQFCRHHGVDWAALTQVIEDMKQGGPVRGASTLSMQTAKNLFLWPERSYGRKSLEIPLALLIDFAWGKRRLLEIYLNIAQWGDRTFGAEAAARRYFHVDAADLTPHQAALLAAALPDPDGRNPARPSHRLTTIATVVQNRLRQARSHLLCLPQARAAIGAGAG